MNFKKIYKEISVDVSLDDFNTQELLDELERRGIFNVDALTKDIETLYTKLKLAQNYEKELSDLVYKTLGKIV